MATNITWHAAAVTHQERAAFLGQTVRGAHMQRLSLRAHQLQALVRGQGLLAATQGLTLWFTGLSASGKSTIATALEHLLLQKRTCWHQ